MPRKTRRTLRRMTPLSRELTKLANEADSLSRRAHNLAAKVAGAETKAQALEAYMVYVDGQEEERTKP